MTDPATFWNKVAPKYAKDAIKDLAAYEYTLERTRSYLRPEDRVLEMGCGTGSTAVLLAPNARQIVGTDISTAMADIARDRARAGGIDNVEFRTINAENSTKLPEAFDVVLGFNLFHLTRAAEGIFSDVYAMLPDGGYFITKTPCLGDPSLGFKRVLFKMMIPPMQWIGKAPFVRFFTFSQLENALESTGFDIVESGNSPAMSRYIVARKR
jgi:cyclopropane fatty-acyl-phospholipid synthase-like methyltransferase